MTTELEILGWCARCVWRDHHGDAPCPDDRVPDKDAILVWLPDCPREAKREANKLLTATLAATAVWFQIRTEIIAVVVSLDDPRETLSIGAVHQAWKALPKVDRPQHPISPLVEAWQERPKKGTANFRDDRILPARLAMVEQNDRRAGRLFASALHIVQQDKQQMLLPGFELDKPRLCPALPLLLYDLGGGPGMDRSAPAPLALRLWVESILAVGLDDRTRNQPVALEIPLRNLLKKLYPGKRRPRPNEYWPRLNQAVEVLDATRIPWQNPESGKGGLQRIVSVSSIPRGPGATDDPVRIIVDLPPGSGVGPGSQPEPGALWSEICRAVSRAPESGLSLVRARPDAAACPGRKTLDPDKGPATL